jgi:hypothetical protein
MLPGGTGTEGLGGAEDELLDDELPWLLELLESFESLEPELLELELIGGATSGSQAPPGSPPGATPPPPPQAARALSAAAAATMLMFRVADIFCSSFPLDSVVISQINPWICRIDRLPDLAGQAGARRFRIFFTTPLHAGFG